jgi:dolichyl-phosphate beta-glucosyltransferase
MNVSSNQISLSLVIPAYNEERRLPESLRDIQSFFKQMPEGLEILVIVEKSSDRTVEVGRATVAGDPRFQIIDNQVHRGKGFAVKSGMLRAKGDLVIFMDADLSTPLAEVFSFVQHFAQHPDVDVLIGSRAHAKSQIVKKQSWLRQNMGRTFNKFVKSIALGDIEDTQCGFKAFRKRACAEIFARQKTDGFAFDVEILMLARALGFKVDILPVRWVNSPDSKVRIWIDPLKMLWDLFRIRRLVRRSVREQPLSLEARASR